MGIRFGEKKSKAVKTIRKAGAAEKEFIEAGDKKDTPAQLKRVDRLSDFQIDQATDEIIMGESIARVARGLKVSANGLAKKIKTRLHMLYLRKWQQSVEFDCLRAELILKKALVRYVQDGEVKDGKLALDVLNYRARVLSFGVVNPNAESERVAGMSREDVFNAIIEKL